MLIAVLAAAKWLPKLFSKMLIAVLAAAKWLPEGGGRREEGGEGGARSAKQRKGNGKGRGRGKGKDKGKGEKGKHTDDGNGP